jgi:putative copper resistance protein D
MLSALAATRFLHFSATMLLFGANGFLWGLAPPGLARQLATPIRRASAAALAVAALSALAWLALEAGAMGEGWRDMVDPGTLSAVAFDTAFGRLWLARLALAALLAAALAFWPRRRFGAVAFIAGLLLASLALTGHAAMQTGLAGALQRANHAVHLLAAGAWLGALPPLLLCLRHLASGDEMRGEAGAALRRFSGLGHVAVALVVATGIVNAALILGLRPPTLASPYQRLLAAKTAIVAGMIGVALYNRYALTPRIRRGSPAALDALCRATLAEIALGLVVLALVSLFALLPPA